MSFSISSPCNSTALPIPYKCASDAKTILHCQGTSWETFGICAGSCNQPSSTTYPQCSTPAQPSGGGGTSDLAQLGIKCTGSNFLCDSTATMILQCYQGAYALVGRCTCQTNVYGNPYCVNAFVAAPVVLPIVSPTVTIGVVSVVSNTATDEATDSATDSTDLTDVTDDTVTTTTSTGQTTVVVATTTTGAFSVNVATTTTTSTTTTTTTTAQPPTSGGNPGDACSGTSYYCSADSISIVQCNGNNFVQIGNTCPFGCQSLNGVPFCRGEPVTEGVNIGGKCGTEGQYTCNVDGSMILECYLGQYAQIGDSCNCQIIGSQPYCMGPYVKSIGTTVAPATTPTTTTSTTPSSSFVSTSSIQTTTTATTTAVVSSNSVTTEMTTDSATDEGTDSATDATDATDSSEEVSANETATSTSHSTVSVQAIAPGTISTNQAVYTIVLPTLSPAVVYQTNTAARAGNAGNAASESRRTVETPNALQWIIGLVLCVDGLVALI
ncbi:hypothetical protein BCR33DRAFT_771988 [Rhizoclosmatium globosum]|uniref:Uncharacterized protein n=1 Tax=Rhizoclosmatium globosum TaxID=329046 RepID=A0A1Y2B8K5_9FUNG|nr:hypothetical protein BCR33DRAFT_771988 [Rhizoclosmatium globosum]|eukprot:ORY31162.1 hypothetical protein BCR33DRAFT_771988 [Rhizoclosmatium globosum]